MGALQAGRAGRSKAHPAVSALTSCAPCEAHRQLQGIPTATHSASYSGFTFNFHLVAIKIDRFSHQSPVNYTQIFPAQLSPLPSTSNFFQDSAFLPPISNAGWGACCESRACTGTGNCAKAPHLLVWTAFQGAMKTPMMLTDPGGFEIRPRSKGLVPTKSASHSCASSCS